MKNFHPLSQCPKNKTFKQGDLLVVYGEVFDKGYVNGLIDEALKVGMTVVSGTVGRRDEEGKLRALNNKELAEKSNTTVHSALINIPLEAGFDLSPSLKGLTPCDQLKSVKRDEWDKVKIDWGQINESLSQGQQDFEERSKSFFEVIEKEYLKEGQNVHFAHTMAGGIPRAKILMPLLNRVFKGTEKRFLSSKEFWESEIGRLCDMSFDEVTARTFEVLIEQTESIRTKANHVSYSAYGYHGCAPLLNDEYKWQSYAPYLQGFAKIKLENIAKDYWEKGVKAQVFNCPEILTNSSSVFMGVEVCLYPLLRALKFENDGKETSVHKECAALLKDPKKLDEVDMFTQSYMNEDEEQTLYDWNHWPTHNSPEQMLKTQEASKHLTSLHSDSKKLMTVPLSEVVFKTTGRVILNEASNPQKPVWWLGHDVVAKTQVKDFE